MAIADRITSIEEHIKESYQELEGIGIDITGVDKNLENIPKLIDEYWETLPKVTGEGTSITLDNTKEGKMKIVLKGNTYQEETPTPDSPVPIQVVSGDNSIEVVGENLFTIKNYSKSGYNVKIDNPLKGQSAGTYTISCENLIPNEDGRGCAMLFLNENNQRVGNYFVGYDFGNTLFSNTKNLTQEELDAPYMRLDFNNNNATQEGINRAKIMINKGNKKTYTPYESASYPISLGNIELLKIGTYQDKIDKSSGKNLYNKETITTGSYVNASTGAVVSITGTFATDYIEIKPSTSYYWNDTGNRTNAGAFYNESKTYISGISTRAFTSPSNAKYVRLTGDNSIIDTGMLNEGTTALEYEPYGTGWYVKKEIGKVVLDGSEANWSNQFGINLFSLQAFLNNNKFIVGYSLSNYYKYNSIQSGINTGTVNGEFALQESSGNYNLFIKNTDYSSVDNFKTWLSTHNTSIYYPLATPTYTEITDSTLINQLETIKKSYEGQTNITQENNDMPFELDIEALKGDE